MRPLNKDKVRTNIKANISFVFIVVVVTSLFWTISSKGIPPIPRYACHTLAQTNYDCLVCYGEGQEVARFDTGKN